VRAGLGVEAHHFDLDHVISASRNNAVHDFEPMIAYPFRLLQCCW
jgi:hypothetical protein